MRLRMGTQISEQLDLRGYFEAGKRERKWKEGGKGTGESAPLNRFLYDDVLWSAIDKIASFESVESDEGRYLVVNYRTTTTLSQFTSTSIVQVGVASRWKPTACRALPISYVSRIVVDQLP